MTRYNILIAQFLIMAFLGGFPIGAIIYSLFLRYGFQGVFVGILSGTISLPIFAFVIYRKWLIEKDLKPQIIHGKERSYKFGNALLSIGNIVAILSVFGILIPPVLGVDYVIGGIIVFFGGGISILFWLGGWSWIDSSLIKYH